MNLDKAYRELCAGKVEEGKRILTEILEREPGNYTAHKMMYFFEPLDLRKSVGKNISKIELAVSPKTPFERLDFANSIIWGKDKSFHLVETYLKNNFSTNELESNREYLLYFVNVLKGKKEKAYQKLISAYKRSPKYPMLLLPFIYEKNDIIDRYLVREVLAKNFTRLQNDLDRKFSSIFLEHLNGKAELSQVVEVIGEMYVRCKNDYWLGYWYGEALIWLGQYVGAEQVLGSLIDKFPFNDPGIRYGYAFSLYKNGNLKAAKIALDEILQQESMIISPELDSEISILLDKIKGKDQEDRSIYVFLSIGAVVILTLFVRRRRGEKV